MDIRTAFEVCNVCLDREFEVRSAIVAKFDIPVLENYELPVRSPPLIQISNLHFQSLATSAHVDQ